MIDIDNVKSICYNLEKQHSKISETYNELINSLKLENEVNELKEVINNKEKEINNLTNVVNEYKLELENKNEVINKLNDVINNNNKEIENKNNEIALLKDELNNVKNIGNMILNLHNQQFVKLLSHMDKMIQYTEWYNFDVRRNGYNSMKERVFVNNSNKVICGNLVNKSSLELLVDVNNKFTKLSINVMKLLSHLDHNNMYNITYSNHYNYYNYYRNNIPMNYVNTVLKQKNTVEPNYDTNTLTTSSEQQEDNNKEENEGEKDQS